MRRPKMTAEEARSFEGYCPQNAAAVEAALKERGCRSCRPYEDVFTLPRWNAQGYRVTKGEKSISVRVWIAMDASKADTERALDEGEEAPKPRVRPKTAHLFCRCQVHEAAQKVAA